MMDSITVGANIRMTEAVTGDYPVGSTATILYIDEMDNTLRKDNGQGSGTGQQLT